LRRADPTSKQSYRLCKKDYVIEIDARAQERAVVLLMMMNQFLKMLFGMPRRKGDNNNTIALGETILKIRGKWN
jgi:hypothetical protein